MGSHSSKAAKGDVMAQDAARDASPAKSNGQENGHLKINGDVSPKADGEASSLNGSSSAEAAREPAKAETGGGDTIEPAPVAESEAKPDGAAPGAVSKETPKKKKRFSFKKSFKLSGISFRKAKKETGDTSAASSPSEEQGKAEAEGEETAAAAAAATTTTGEGEQASAAKEEEVAAAAPEEEEEASVTASAPDNQLEPVAKRQDGSDGQGKKEEEEEQLQQPSGESQGDAKLDETATSGEPEPSAAVAAEQKEE